MHSQGNAIVSEAIRRGGVSFDTYILTQGALPDSAYDVDAPINTDIASHEHGEYITPEWQPMGYHGIYTNFTGPNFTGKIVNFYNPLDKVLGYWVDDQKLLKPSVYFDTSHYYYDGVNSYFYPVLADPYLVTDPRNPAPWFRAPALRPSGRVGLHRHMGLYNQPWTLTHSMDSTVTPPMNTAPNGHGQFKLVCRITTKS